MILLIPLRFLCFSTTFWCPSRWVLAGGFSCGTLTTFIVMEMLTAHGIHRLDNVTKVRLARIEGDRILEIARLERNGTLFRCAQAGIQPPACPIIITPVSRYLAPGDRLSCFTVLPLILAIVLQASTDMCTVQTVSVSPTGERMEVVLEDSTA